jgi:hypothetical protein
MTHTFAVFQKVGELRSIGREQAWNIDAHQHE